jgi:acyl-CoA hydrolase
VRHTASAYLTFVALGPDNRPVNVPPVIFENEDQERRAREAKARSEMRKQERLREAGS